MRVQARVEVNAEELNDLQLDYVKSDLSRLFAKECVGILPLEEFKGFIPGSKIFSYDGFLINQKNFTYIMEYLQAIKFLSTSKVDDKFVDKIIALLKE